MKLLSVILILFLAFVIALPAQQTLRNASFDKLNVRGTATFSGTGTHSGTETFSQQIISTVATGTAPFSISSTTVVPNLNAQLHNGLTAPGSAIVGISDNQTLTNKTLTGASSGNSVSLLNAQGNSAAVTGTGAAATLYTYTLPASTVANLKGIRVTVGVLHSTGSASVNYVLNLNGQQVAQFGTSAVGSGLMFCSTVLNTGSTTGVATNQLNTTNAATSGYAATVTGLSWSAGQTVQFTFSVAGTDQVTPILFLVELLQ
jgi:hypothetical protein